MIIKEIFIVIFQPSFTLLGYLLIPQNIMPQSLSHCSRPCNADLLLVQVAIFSRSNAVRGFLIMASDYCFFLTIAPLGNFSDITLLSPHLLVLPALH